MAHRSGRQLGRKTDAALQRRIAKRRRKICKRALAVGLPLYAEHPGTSRNGCDITFAADPNALKYGTRL